MTDERRIGQTAILNGRKVVWSGQNYGWQSPSTHNKLRDQGKFKAGAQALDRLQQSAGNAVRAIANSPAGQAAQRAHRGFVQATDKIPGIKQLEGTLERASTSTPQARAAQGAGVLTQSAANRLNVDPRIAATGLLLGQLAIGRAGASRTGSGTPRLDGRPGVVPPHTPTTTAQQRAGLRAAATRQAGPTKLQGTRQLPPNAGPNGRRLFTPANRAGAVQRANAKNQDKTGGDLYITNNAIGVEGGRALSRGDNDVAFQHSNQKMRVRGTNNPYADRREFGDTPKSKVGEKIRAAGLKDMMGRTLDVPNHETVTASPTTKSRAILYARGTNNALAGSQLTGKIKSTRVSDGLWINHQRGDARVKFNPNDMRQPLQKLTESQATLVGRRAGGNSKVQANRVNANAPKRASKPLLQPADNEALSRKIAARDLARTERRNSLRERTQAAQDHIYGRSVVSSGTTSPAQRAFDAEVASLVSASGRRNLGQFTQEERQDLFARALSNLRSHSPAPVLRQRTTQQATPRPQRTSGPILRRSQQDRRMGREQNSRRPDLPVASHEQRHFRNISSPEDLTERRRLGIQSNLRGNGRPISTRPGVVYRENRLAERASAARTRATRPNNPSGAATARQSTSPSRESSATRELNQRTVQRFRDSGSPSKAGSRLGGDRVTRRLRQDQGTDFNRWDRVADAREYIDYRRNRRHSRYISRVSPEQRQRVRRATGEANINANMSRPRTAAEERAVQNFLRRDPNTRDTGGRRTWNGTHRTLRIRRRRS